MKLEFRLTPNQLVAFNLRKARKLCGWTQEEAAERLAPYLGEHWSKATFSIAERSWLDDGRTRQFTADELVALAAAFDLPFSFFFTPPTAAGETAGNIGARNAREGLDAARLSQLVTGSADKRVAALTKARIQEMEEGLR